MLSPLSKPYEMQPKAALDQTSKICPKAVRGRCRIALIAEQLPHSPRCTIATLPFAQFSLLVFSLFLSCCCCGPGLSASPLHPYLLRKHRDHRGHGLFALRYLLSLTTCTPSQPQLELHTRDKQTTPAARVRKQA